MPRPPYDPELAAVLELLTAAAPPLVLRPESIAELRAFNETYVLDPAAYPATSFTEAVVEAADGAEIRLLVMRPLGPAVAAGSLVPGLLYLHGGGMVAGHHRVALDETLGWVEAVPMVAVSVDYRLAPEHRHPVPVEDCYAGLRWLVENAEELGVDPARIVVAGGSAGGGLALRSAGPGHRSLVAAACLPRRRIGRPLPGRDGRLRLGAVGGRRASRAARLGRRVPRLRSPCPARSALAGGTPRSGAVATPYRRPRRFLARRGTGH
jgi:hypothetical protein